MVPEMAGETPALPGGAHAPTPTHAPTSTSASTPTHAPTSTHASSPTHASPPGSAGVPPASSPAPSAESPPAKNWHSRGYLPHFDHPGLVQSITFRLADALPAQVVQRLRASAADDARFRASLEDYLNAGHGACLLRHPAHARSVEDALLHFDGQRYRLLAWVVMPNHVHVLIETRPGHPLDAVVHSWKSVTAHAILKTLATAGETPTLPALWQREYFDRFIRDERHLQAVIDYIDNNPVKAGLVAHAGDWPFGSAWERRRLQ